MTEKTSVWDLFNNSAELIETDQKQPSQISNKRAKTLTTKNEITWLKTLLHPSAEKQFIKFKVKEVISSSNQHIICKLEAPNEDGQSRITEYTKFNTLIGFFSVWWWKEWLDKLDFSTLQDLLSSFPFLTRIRRTEQLILPKTRESLDFYLLVNEPKTVPNENNLSAGLVTSRRFLVVDWREDD